MRSAVAVIALNLCARLVPAAENCKQPEKGPARSTSNAMDEIQLSLAQKGKTLVTELGQTLCLRLPGDRANGSWSLSKLTGNALRQTGKSQYIAGPHDVGKIGGVTVFRFKAVKSGKSTI